MYLSRIRGDRCINSHENIELSQRDSESFIKRVLNMVDQRMCAFLAIINAELFLDFFRMNQKSLKYAYPLTQQHHF